MTEIDSIFFEKLMAKTMLVDKDYLVDISRVYEKEYFDNPSVGHLFEFARKHFEEFKTLPEREIIIHSTEDKDDIQELFSEIDSIDYDTIKGRDYVITTSNEYLKEKALKQSILDSVNIIDSNGNREEIREVITAALSKDMKIDLGLDYFGQLGKRLTRIFNASDIRVPTYYSQFDEYINGGFPPFTLSVIVARVHMGKSNIMANFAARQVLHGHNVVLMTLEMSQDAFAQRFDSIYSKLDINRMYVSDELKKKLVSSLTAIKKQENRGNLYIKQFPTGGASVSDFRIYLRELMIRDIKPDILYVDYINLMRSYKKIYGDNMYSKVKGIAEELRALSFEFEVPVISVSQLNREGSNVAFSEVDFTYVAESYGIPETSDFLAILGTNEDEMVYESEIHYILSKNRLGGRVGESDLLYWDRKSLGMYDRTEEEIWMNDAGLTGDDRRMYERENR